MAASATERRERNRAIAAAREDGATWAEIAERFGLSERHARRAFLEYLRSAGQVDLDADETLREILNVHVWALEELRLLALKADNDGRRRG